MEIPVFLVSPQLHPGISLYAQIWIFRVNSLNKVCGKQSQILTFRNVWC